MSTDQPDKIVVFTGYPIKTVRELLGIKKETFRYWRANIDPNPFRSKFMPKEILVYRIMKMFIQKRRVQVKELSNYNWSEIFEICESNSYKHLKKYIAVLNDAEKTLKLIGPDIKIDGLDPDLATVQLSRIIDEHIQEFSNPTAKSKKSRIISLRALR